MEQRKKVILFEKREEIGIITLNRPEEKNVFNEEMLLVFEDLLKKTDNDDSVKSIILKGNGKAFCTGIDLKLISNRDEVEIFFWMKRLQKITNLLRELSKPVIAMVQDLALAFGIGLVAASDLAIAAKGARFGAIAINIGLFCMGPGVFLMQNIGLKKTFELLFTGKIIDADEALKIGLINEVVLPEELETRTISLAKEVGLKDSWAVKLGKRFFYKISEKQTLMGSELASHYFSLLFSKWNKKVKSNKEEKSGRG